MKYLFHYILPTPNKIWEDKDKAQQTSLKTQVFFRENRSTTYLTTTLSKLFCIISVNIYIFLKSLTYQKINRIRIFTT